MGETPGFLTPLLLTLKVAGCATLISFVAGVGIAYALNGRGGAFKDLLGSILTLPMVLPPSVLGYYIIVTLGRRGWFGSWLWDMFGVTPLFTWQGAVIAASMVSLPLVFTTASAAFESVDRNLEDAALTLGMSRLAVFSRVSAPLAWRGILAGALLAFARAFGEFGATLMVAGNMPGRTQTLSLAIYSAVEAGDDPLAFRLVLVTSVACLAILMGSRALLARKA